MISPHRQLPTVKPALDRWLPVGVALIIAILFGLSHAIMWHKLRATGQSYAPLVVDGVQALTYDETTYYAPRIRDVLDGHPFSAAPADYEHKQETPFLGVGVIAPLFIAALAKLIGGSVAGAFVLCDFLLPPVSFLLIYLLCRRIGAGTWVGVAAGLLVVLAHDQISLPFVVAGNPTWQRLADHLHIFGSVRPMEYSRLPVPQFSYILFLLAIIGLYQTRRNPRPSTIVLTGLAIGSLFYSYVFFWTYIVVGTGLWVLILAAQRNWQAAGAVALATGVGCLLGLPVLLALAGPLEFPGREYLVARQSWGGRHIRLLTHHKYEWALLLTYFIIYPWRRREFPFITAFVLAAYGCLFVSRVVNLNVQEWHWFGRCWYPWLSIALPLGIWARVNTQYDSQRWRRWAQWGRQYALRPVMIGLGTLCLAYGFNDHISYGLNMYQRHTLPSGTQAALNWLGHNAATDSVVMAADMNVLALVPVYTQCNSYLPYCLVTPAADEELVERFWITAAICGLSDEYVDHLLAPDEPVDGFFQPHRWWAVNWLYHMKFGTAALPAEVRADVKAKGIQITKMPVAKLMNKYKLDYLWVDDVVANDSSHNFTQLPYLTQVFAASGTRLYAVK